MLRAGVSMLALLVAGCASVDKELLDAQLPDPPQKWAAAEDVATPPVGDWLAPFGDQALRSRLPGICGSAQNQGEECVRGPIGSGRSLAN